MVNIILLLFQIGKLSKKHWNHAMILNLIVLNVICIVISERIKRCIIWQLRRCRCCWCCYCCCCFCCCWCCCGWWGLYRRLITLVELPTSLVGLFISGAVGLRTEHGTDEKLDSVSWGCGSTLMTKCSHSKDHRVQILSKANF